MLTAGFLVIFEVPKLVLPAVYKSHDALFTCCRLGSDRSTMNC